MKLVERDRHDHPEAHPFLPQVGCGVCGRAVQPLIELAEGEHWDWLDVAIREEAVKLMSLWSHEHAATHSGDEHQARQRALDEAHT